MPTKTLAQGRTEVTAYEPAAYDEREGGPTLNEVQLAETFTGDIEGEGSARVLQALWADGASRYCTIERIAGTLAGRPGTFLLQVEGTVRGGHNTGTWSVIAGSATGELRGCAATAGSKPSTASTGRGRSPTGSSEPDGRRTEPQRKRSALVQRGSGVQATRAPRSAWPAAQASSAGRIGWSGATNQ